MRKHVVKNHLK